MRCTHCDNLLPPGAQFCIDCGCRVPHGSSAGAKTQRVASPAAEHGWPLDADWRPDASSMLRPYVAPAPPQPTQVAVAAIVSLVFGILGWFVLLFVGAIIAVIAGHIA